MVPLPGSRAWFYSSDTKRHQELSPDHFCFPLLPGFLLDSKNLELEHSAEGNTKPAKQGEVTAWHTVQLFLFLHGSPNCGGNRLILVTLSTEQPLKILIHYSFLGFPSWRSAVSPPDAGIILCHQHYLLRFLISFSHFFLGMTGFLILSAMSFWHYGTVCKVLGEKHCHNKGSQLPSSAVDMGSGLRRHLLPGVAAAEMSFLHYKHC